MSDNRTDVSEVRSAKTEHHRFQFGWKGWAILTGCVCMVAVSIILAMTTDFTTKLRSHTSPERETRSANSLAMRTATIVLETDGHRCEIRKFDNDSGGVIVEDSKRCHDPAILDSHGIPVPTGTIHRLDAISKSYEKAR